MAAPGPKLRIELQRVSSGCVTGVLWREHKETNLKERAITKVRAALLFVICFYELMKVA